MKKFLALILVLALALPFGVFASETYEIALVTDVGNIDDKSFNQCAWEGVSIRRSKRQDLRLLPARREDSTDARVESMKTAIDKGAKVIVLPGYLFADAISEVQRCTPK